MSTLFDMEDPLPPGLWIRHERIDSDGQRELVAEIEKIVAVTGWLQPTMRRGTPLRLQITNAGKWGWWSDELGYRYTPVNPKTFKPWPEIPLWIKTIAGILVDEAFGPGKSFDPDSLLINRYGNGDSLGLHRDDTEEDLTSPIVSISLGDTCEFVFGSTDKGDKPRKFTLRSGDVVVFGGPARLAYHAVPKIYPGTSGLVACRYNLTLRRVKSEAR